MSLDTSSGTWGEGWASDFGGEPQSGLVAPPGSDRMGSAIQAVIAAAMDIPSRSVRPADQAMPSGNVDGGYATYRISATEDASIPEQTNATQDDGSELEAVTVMQYLTVSVNFFRGRDPQSDDAGLPRYTTGAFDQASRLPRRLQLSAYYQMLRDAGLGFIGASDPRNLAGITDKHWESRGQIDIYLSAIALETAPVTVFSGIGTVGINVENPAGVLSTQTITP